MEIVTLPHDAPDDGPVPLLQSAAAALALGARRVAVQDGNRVIAQALLLTRAGLTATLRGPIWHTDASPPNRIAALRALRRAGLRLVEAEDATSAELLRAAGFRMVVTPAHVAELDLTPNLASRRRALDPKWRGHLSHAERNARPNGITLHCRPLSGPSDPLLLAELAQRRTRGYRALPPAFAAAFPNAEVAEARQNGTPVAAMLFLRHGHAATYHIAHTTDAGRKSDAHRLLLWDAMNRLATEGITRLDLGTIDTVTSPDLARFKLGTGATARPLGGSFLAIPFL
jgi:hypothetical protein